MIDRALGSAGALRRLKLAGKHELLGQLFKWVVQSAPDGEFADRLTYPRCQHCDSADRNARNIKHSTIILTENDTGHIAVLPDPRGSLELELVAKPRGRLAQPEDIVISVISLPANGLA